MPQRVVLINCTVYCDSTITTAGKCKLHELVCMAFHVRPHGQIHQTIQKLQQLKFMYTKCKGITAPSPLFVFRCCCRYRVVVFGFVFSNLRPPVRRPFDFCSLFGVRAP